MTILPQGLQQRPYGRPNHDNSRHILALSSTSSGTTLSMVLSIPRLLRQCLKSWWIHFCKVWSVAVRSIEIAVRLSPLALLAPLCLVTQSKQFYNLTWRYAISAIQAMGPVAVKFCQWVATRRDIFPPQLCDRLGILHDQGFPHSWEHTQSVLVHAFGEDYQEKGLCIDKEDSTVIVGCGSAAQVYRGTLRSSNGTSTVKRTVAVKVLHPQFAWMVERDLSLLQTIAEWLHSIPSDAIRMVNLPRATQNFGDILRLQADLTKEAQNLQQFRKNFVKYHASIHFPQPIPEWSHPNVLVEEYVPEAIPIATFLRDSSPEGNKTRRELAGPLLRAFLKMVFVSALVLFVFFLPPPPHIFSYCLNVDYMYMFMYYPGR
jgi:aarF domain-containing kinase